MSASEKKLVEVAVLTGLPTVLTYQVPGGSAPTDLVGRRVIVPLQRRKQLGVIVSTDGTFDGVTKPIIGFPDFEPVISAELLQLARFVSEYYFTPLGEVIRAILPSALSGKVRQEYHIVDRTELKTAASAGDENASNLLELLGRRRKLGLFELERANLNTDVLRAANYGELRWNLKPLGDKGDHPAKPFGASFMDSSANHVAGKAIKLNAAQENAVAAVLEKLLSGTFEPFLLHGVTGSGKTEVYLELVKRVAALGNQALIVVPEIGLSQVLHDRLASTFGNSLGLLHSRLSATERFEVWQKARNLEIRVVLGARSAVFSDLPRLRLIVVDEEHDQSLKQHSPAPRYHARDVAIMRGKLQVVPVLLGSATPAVESYHNALSGKYTLLQLPERIEARAMPLVTIVDQRERFKMGDFSSLSPQLLTAIGVALGNNEQIMVLLNRRGFAPSVRCYDCGEKLTCRNCDVTLVYHKAANKILCHTCGHQESYPDRCPNCQSNLFLYGGIGTERLEEELRSHFPDAGIVRMDFDSTRRKGSFNAIFRKFNSGEANLLLGTQMISKGFDFPQVSLVGVVSADTALELPDFRARERTFQLLTQVAGRAGRGEIAGTVLMQTLNPEEKVIKFAAKHDYRAFFDTEISERRDLNFPPFCHLILISLEATSRELASEQAELLSKRLGSLRRGAFRVLGPVTAPLAKRKQVYRFHLMLKTERVKATLSVLQHILQAKEFQHNRRFRVIVDVDAVDML